MLVQVVPSYRNTQSSEPSSHSCIERRSSAHRFRAFRLTLYSASSSSTATRTGTSSPHDRGARRYGARRYWQGPKEQFSHGTRSVSLRSRSVWRVNPNTASNVFFGRNMPESNASTEEGKGSFRVRF